MDRKGLVDKVISKNAKIGVIGLGYVGLPLALRFSQAGFSVTGLDVNPEKIKVLNGGGSYLSHIPSEIIRDTLAKGFSASDNFEDLSEFDAFFICVPTPLNKSQEPDLSYVTTAIDALLPSLRRGQAICLESTTYPGTTEEVLLPKLQESGLRVGENLFLIYSPEREDPGRGCVTSRDIPKLYSGHTSSCKEVGKSLYSAIVDNLVELSSTKAAEMTKLCENVHRAVNIGLANELKKIAHNMGLDIQEIMDAAATKPFGYTPYQPGPGVGGHCIPVDPFYLTWKAKEFGIHSRFIELAGEINASMPEYVVGKVQEGLNNRGLSLKGSRILILGASYKKDVGDTRESPALKILELLKIAQAEIAYTDPYVDQVDICGTTLKSLELNRELLGSFDTIVLATNHTVYDYTSLLEDAREIVDTRGVFPKHSKVIRA